MRAAVLLLSGGLAKAGAPPLPPETHRALDHARAQARGGDLPAAIATLERAVADDKAARDPAAGVLAAASRERLSAGDVPGACEAGGRAVRFHPASEAAWRAHAAADRWPEGGTDVQNRLQRLTGERPVDDLRRLAGFLEEQQDVRGVHHVGRCDVAETAPSLLDGGTAEPQPAWATLAHLTAQPLSPYGRRGHDYRVFGQAAWTHAVAAAAAALVRDPPPPGDEALAGELLALALVFAHREARDHGWTGAWAASLDRVATAAPHAIGLDRARALRAVDERDWAEAEVQLASTLGRWDEDRVGRRVAMELAAHDPSMLTHEARRAIERRSPQELAVDIAAVRAAAGEADRCVAVLGAPGVGPGRRQHAADLREACRAVAADPEGTAARVTLVEALRTSSEPRAALRVLDGIGPASAEHAARIGILRAWILLELGAFDAARDLALSAALPPPVVLRIAEELRWDGRKVDALAVLDPEDIGLPVTAIPAE